MKPSLCQTSFSGRMYEKIQRRGSFLCTGEGLAGGGKVWSGQLRPPGPEPLKMPQRCSAQHPDNLDFLAPCLPGSLSAYFLMCGGKFIARNASAAYTSMPSLTQELTDHA